MLADKINSEKVKDIAVVGGIVIGIYFVYKIFKGISAGKNALGYGDDKKKAEAMDVKVENLKPEDNPFSPSYARSRSHLKIARLTSQTAENMYKTITAKLGLFQTYKHPLSFLEDRKKVNDYILRNCKTKTQLSTLAEVFASHKKDLYTELKEGYRETGWLSGGFKAGEVQALFTTLVKKCLSLPSGVE